MFVAFPTALMIEAEHKCSFWNLPDCAEKIWFSYLTSCLKGRDLHDKPFYANSRILSVLSTLTQDDMRVPHLGCVASRERRNQWISEPPIWTRMRRMRISWWNWFEHMWNIMRTCHIITHGLQMYLWFLLAHSQPWQSHRGAPAFDSVARFKSASARGRMAMLGQWFSPIRPTHPACRGVWLPPVKRCRKAGAIKTPRFVEPSGFQHRGAGNEYRTYGNNWSYSPSTINTTIRISNVLNVVDNCFLILANTVSPRVGKWPQMTALFCQWNPRYWMSNASFDPWLICASALPKMRTDLCLEALHKRGSQHHDHERQERMWAINMMTCI